MNAIRLFSAALIGMATVLSLAPSQAKSLVESTTSRNNPMYSMSHYKHLNKVEVFYISNRNADELEATIQNLRQAGFPQADAQHVVMKGASSDKEPRRQVVAEKHEIAMLVSDNLNDFDKSFYQQDAAKRSALVDANREQFGTRFIILPNAIYGDWESAIWNARPLSPKEADRLKHEALESY